jgi:type IX secretion system PorP/SprF family membrane protein
MLWGLNGFAQYLHLSQNHLNPQLTNPALAGTHEGSYAISANYRNQWSQIGQAPIATFVLAYDQNFYFRSYKVNGGMIILRDQFSTYGINSDKILFNLAVQRYLNGHQLRAGLQVGAGLMSNDLSRQTFPNQWIYQQGEFNPAVASGESELDEQIFYPDANIGINWKKSFNKLIAEGGVAFMHINHPNHSYFDNDREAMNMRPLINAGVTYQLTSSLAVNPQIYYSWTTQVKNGLFGARTIKQYQGKKLQAVSAGLFYRSGFNRIRDALIPMIGMKFKNVEAGLSYDFNIGELSDYGSQKSTLEIGIRYIAPFYSPDKLTVPCSRY